MLDPDKPELRAIASHPRHAGGLGIRAVTIGLVLGGLVLGVWAPVAFAGTDKLLYLGVSRGEGVPERAFASLRDAVSTEVGYAARERGFELVPLRKVAGAADQAKACVDAECRRALVKRLGATHGLSGAVEVKGRGYRVTLLIEDVAGLNLKAKTVV